MRLYGLTGGIASGKSTVSRMFVEKGLPLIDADVAPDDERVLDVMADHYAIVARFWTPNAESYAGLGDLYADSPDFRARFDAEHPRMADYLRDAMAAYAIARLT